MIDSGSVVSKLDSKFIVDNISCLLLTHSHFDHILELPFLLELLLQEGEKPFTVYASEDSIRSLFSNTFNYESWPNLFDIAKKQNIDLMMTEYSTLEKFNTQGYEITPVLVNHTIQTHGFIVDNGNSSLAFTGDTYITDSFWEICNNTNNLKAVIVDISFPSFEKDAALVTKHLGTDQLLSEIGKLSDSSVQIYVSHMKPQYESEIRKEIAEISSDFNIVILEDGMTINL